MKISPFQSLRVRLVMLVLFAVFPALLLTLFTGVGSRRMKVTKAREEICILARKVADVQDRLIEDTRQVLLTLSRMRALREQDQAACSSILADFLGDCRS